MRTTTEKRPRARIIRLVIDGLSTESLIFVEARFPAFVLSNRDGPDDRGPMCPTLNEACLNDAYPGHDAAERTSIRVYRLRPGAFPRSTGLKNTQVASRNFLFVRVKNATFTISVFPPRLVAREQLGRRFGRPAMRLSIALFTASLARLWHRAVGGRNANSVKGRHVLSALLVSLRLSPCPGAITATATVHRCFRDWRLAGP
jgi:hypothetical protein